MRTLYIAAALFISAHLALTFSSVSASEILSASTGIIAFNCMALSLILAARWRWLDALLGGPDKSYQWHRWLGYGAVIGSLGHWVSADDALPSIVPALGDAAGDSGEFAVLSLLLLGLISALKIIPYHWWKKSHLLMGPLFLVLVFHSFFSQSPIPMDSFLWWNQLNLAVLGVIAWMFTLVNLTRPTKLHIKHIHHLPGAIDIRLQKPAGLKFKAGQFASISVDNSALSEAHPFTIASSPDSDELRLVINTAGDYTRRLAAELTLMHKINCHSISGSFVIPTAVNRKRQIWVAAGVGITPFLAALESLQSDNGAMIELIYAPSEALGSQMVEQLQQYAKELPQFSLQLLPKQQRLQAQHFNALTEDWQTAQLLLCGGDNLKQSARKLYLQGGGKAAIKDESFDFRNAIALAVLISYAAAKLPVIYKILSPIVKKLLAIKLPPKGSIEWIKNAIFVTRR